MVQKLEEYDPASETLTPEEGRELIRRSGMILFPGWKINSSFLLDQIRKQEKSISFEDTNIFGETNGARFNIDAKTVEIQSLALAHDKPTLMEIKETPQGNAIFYNVHTTSSDQIYTLMTSTTLLGKNKIDVLQSELETAYDRYVDTKRLYEAEARNNFVLQEANNKLEEEIATLKTNTRLVTHVGIM